MTRRTTPPRAAHAVPANTRATGKATHRYIAFLRAINVGGRTVRMEALAQAFRTIGLADVATFIASGNVFFSTSEAGGAALERRIETGLQRALGYSVATFVRSLEELHEIADYQPFGTLTPASDKTSIYIIFLKKTIEPAARARVTACHNERDAFAMSRGGRELYWLRHGSLLDAPFPDLQLEKGGEAVTMRNRNTILRLAKKHPR